MVTEDDTVIEIGSGIGILTEEIAKRAKGLSVLRLTKDLNHC